MKKALFGIILALFMVLAAVPLIPEERAYADVFTDLGFTTSSEDLENYDQRAVSQPYGSNNITINPVAEEYVVEIGSDSTLQRSLEGDNDLGSIHSGPLPANNNKYVKAAAVDLNGEGKKHAVAELYYREANNGELYLTIVNPGGEVEWAADNTIIDPAVNLKSAATNEILVYSNSGATEPLITDYRNQHTFLNMVTGDFDNDGISEIVVYVPDADDPHLALYQIEDGIIQFSPDQVFKLDRLSEFIYMTSGDITGDNIDDLVISYSAPQSNSLPEIRKVYIFKSQDFSLSTPHVFHRLAENNGENYYTSPYINSSVAIGDLVDNDNRMELVVAGTMYEAQQHGTKVHRTTLSYRYDTASGQWDFEVVQDTYKYSSTFRQTDNDRNLNKLTTLACLDEGNTSNGGADFYVDGFILEWGGDVSDQEPVGDTLYYIDYGAVAGNFNGNSYGREQVKILREKGFYNTNSGVWDSQGLEIATYGLFYGGSLTWGSTKTELSDNTTCAALAAPNTDDDTVIMKYKGHDLQYSYPTILAALASPPYFEDLEHLDGGDSYVGSSCTEITSGQGSGSETHGNVTVTAGAYVSLEQEVSFFGAKITQAEVEQEFTASYAWDTSHETEVSTAITYGTFGGQDSVAVYTIPMDVYMYDVWAPGVGGKGGSWQTMNHCFPYPAAYVVIPAEKYDNIASREEGLPQIGGELFTHTLGRPETYPGSADDMFNVKDPVIYSTPSTVGYGNSYTTQDIEITETNTNSHTFSAELSWRAGAGVAGATIGGIFSIGGGGGWSTTTIKNVGYTGTILNMPEEAEEGGYNYAWQLVAYPYVSEKQNFPVVNYVVTQVRRPPLLPHSFEMQSATNNSITLIWENVDPNVSGYQLYRYYNFEGDLAGYYKIGDVIPVGTNTFTDTNLQPYTYYKYKIQSIGTPYGGQQTTSVLGPECKARTNPASGAPVIVQQPQSVEVAAGSPAVFQIIVQPAANASASDRIFYQWQRWVGGKWKSVEDGSDNLWSINSVTEQDAGRYRCAVSQYVSSDPVTIYSNSVDLTVNKNNLDVTLSFNPNKEFGDINIPITIKAELIDQDMQASPTGRVNFLFTYYSDPVVTDNEGVVQIEYPDPVFTIKEVPVVAGKTAQIDWTPAGYGSYDITAVYLGDDNYHKSTSAVSSFTCVDSTAVSATGLRITGIENNTLTYGDKDIELGATVWQNGSLRNLMTDEVEFISSDAEGLTVVKTEGDNPQWKLSAHKAGTYTLKAITSNPIMQVVKNITVTRTQIGLKAKDQILSQGNAPDPFELELTAGDLKSPDTMDNSFAVQYLCSANTYSPPGVYDIFIDSLTQTADNNYEILSIDKGTVTIDGPKFNIKFRGVSNGTMLAEINNWRVLEENFTTGYDIAAGSRVRFSAIPDTGYRIEKWVLTTEEGSTAKMKDGSETEYDTSQYLTVNSLGDNLSIEVYFAPDLCELTYSAGANGILEASIGNVSVGSGASLPAQTVVSFLATPDDGYMVGQWMVNDAVVSGYTRNSYNHTVTRDTEVKVLFAPVEYAAVHYFATGKGQVTAKTSNESEVADGGLVIKGSDVVFTAIPTDANSMVKEWLVNGQVVQGSRTVYTAENIQGPINVEAIFMDAITYTVNFGALGYGAEALTAEVDGVAIHSGDRVRGYSDITFTAFPPDGYGVKQWKRGSAVIQDEFGSPVTSETYILEELKSSVTVTVEFESTNTYRVDYSVVDTLPDEDGGENGSLSARVTYRGISSDYSSGDDIVPGSRVDLIAVPDSGYRVKEWVVNEQTVTDSVYGVYTLANVNMDFDVTVEFEEGVNPLTYAAVGYGTMDGDVPSGTEVDDGTAVSFTAVPDDGYQIKEWRYNGDVVEGSADCTITVYNGGYVEVEFEREYYTLTLGENLSASVDGIDLQGNSVQVQGDKTVIVSADPPAGYLLTSWYMDEVLLEEEQGDSLSFTMEQNTEVTANFEQQHFSVTFSAGDNGTLTATADEVEISSGFDQPGGSRLVFTAQPDEGYRVQDWYSGQQAAGSRDETYIIDGLSKPEYIQVYFEVIPDEPVAEEYLVYFSAGSGGSISAAADGTPFSSGAAITAGSRVVFTAQADSGKTVDSWSGVDNGTVADTKLTFTIDSLASNENVLVTFKDTTTNSSPSGGGGGGFPTSKPVNSTTGSASVKPSAGGSISLGTEASIIVPAGALQGSDTQRLEITRVESPAAAPSGFMVLGQVYEFQVDGGSSYTFDEPVTLTFTYDPDQVPEGVTPSIYYYDSAQGRWIDLGGTISGNTISVEVDHFTNFTVLVKQKAAAPQPAKPVFSDIESHWAKERIESLADRWIAGGYPDGTFRPDQNITRAEFAALLVNALELQNLGDGRIFSDTSGHWAEDSISIAASYGIINGYDESHFGPDDFITREQMAVMTAKAAKLSGASEETGFIDHALISTWARSDVAAAVSNGIMSGYPDKSFKPRGNATRAEAITVISNLL